MFCQTVKAAVVMVTVHWPASLSSQCPHNLIWKWTSRTCSKLTWQGTSILVPAMATTEVGQYTYLILHLMFTTINFTVHINRKIISPKCWYWCYHRSSYRSFKINKRSRKSRISVPEQCGENDTQECWQDEEEGTERRGELQAANVQHVAFRQEWDHEHHLQLQAE